MPEVLFLLPKGGKGDKNHPEVPSSTSCNKRSCSLENSNLDNIEIVLLIPLAIVSLVIILTASFANNDFAFLTAQGCVCYLGQLGAVAASSPASHQSCEVSSSGCRGQEVLLAPWGFS